MHAHTQHTHPALPHYVDGEWEWLRGALATVDRSYGRVLDAVFHHITDTHVAHHLFPQMPHYHAQARCCSPFSLTICRRARFNSRAWTEP